ncbi:hypothetical protein SELMODRAFT_428537 [Selaginella moellendorffii]|uniref:Bulb-type lectin domain-containing protein n=1 Tax=Selaginella moellendorffii TaxID=88036 RepID=D8T361_SELML|nr:hypothetical protein SELMODRAFT_428537 [Selaginella moellendorffii]
MDDRSIGRSQPDDHEGLLRQLCHPPSHPPSFYLSIWKPDFKDVECSSSTTVASFWQAFPDATLAFGDDGNLVLSQGPLQGVWQSFDHPTDSLFVNEILKLVSSASPTNESHGSFYLELQPHALVGFARSPGTAQTYLGSGELSELDLIDILLPGEYRVIRQGSCACLDFDPSTLKLESVIDGKVPEEISSVEDQCTARRDTHQILEAPGYVCRANSCKDFGQ